MSPSTNNSKKRNQKVGVDSVSRSNTPLYVAIGAIIAVAVIAAVVWAVTKDDTNGSAAKDLLEFQPVSITGDPLPEKPQSGPDPAVGKPIPQIKGASFDNTPVEITNDGKAKAIMLVAHWCPHCRNEVPKVTSFIKDKGDDYPVDYYAIATGSSPQRANYPPSQWLKSAGFPGTVLADDRSFPAGNAFGLTTYPTTVFVDTNNNVVARATGEMDEAQFEQYVKAAAGQGAAPTTTAAPAPAPAG